MTLKPFRPGSARGLFSRLISSLLLLAALPAFADPRLVGHWQGTIELPGAKLEIDVDFAESAGVLSGDISIPAQQLKDFGLVGISAEGDTVRFAMAGIPGEPKFEGKLAADGSKIAGSFSQGGASFPFELASSKKAAAGAQRSLEGLDVLLEQAVADWNVPGLGLAVVSRGEVIYARGFGYRDLEQKLPMTADTLFAIGSSSKAMTATLLGMLVDEGKLKWDEPVVTYLPDFRLADAEITRRVTPRDLLTHRMGMPRHELVWYNNLRSSREELIGRMAHLELNADLRERWQYNNLGFLTAGYLAGKLAGESWEETMRERLLEPLGMSRTVLTLAELERDGDHALPYRRKDEKLERIPYRNIDTIGPAGSVDSSVNEMSRWLLFNLSGGKAGERQLIQAGTLAEIHSPQMVMGQAGADAKIAQQAYGLGWMVKVYRGHRLIEHGGAIDGFSTAVSFFPDDGIGIVAFTNRNSALPGMLSLEVADRLMGLEKIDWMADALKRGKEAEAAGAAAQEAAKQGGLRAEKQGPSHPLADYPGVYEHPGYGRLEVLAGQGKALLLRFNEMEAPLQHWHYDVWSVPKGQGDPIFETQQLLFRTNFTGDVEAVEANFELLAKPIVFVKQADPNLSNPAYLERYQGTYEMTGAPLKAEIAVSGNQLTLYVPGQPLHLLLAEPSGRFRLASVQGFSLAFEDFAGSRYRKVVLHQPNGVFELKRVEEPTNPK